jgi:hypothetical protein
VREKSSRTNRKNHRLATAAVNSAICAIGFW